MLLNRFDGSFLSDKVYHNLNNYRIAKVPLAGGIRPTPGEKHPKAWTDFSKAKEKDHDLTYEQYVNNQKT